MLKKGCVFCDRNIVADGLIHETENFYAKIPLAAIAPGHLLIIPKEHYDCLAEISDELGRELNQFKKSLMKKITFNFSRSLLVEYGRWGQSVKHAHLHLIPAKSEDYEVESMIKEMVIPAKVHFEKGNFERLRKIYAREKSYLLIEENEEMFIVHTSDLDENKEAVKLDVRIFFTGLGVEGISSWAALTAEQKIKDEQKRKITKEKILFD